MKPSICPYLGLKDDPDTTLNFPSEGNFCHRVRSNPPVSREYQREMCLSSEHVTCPVFLGAQEGAYPPGFLAPQSRTIQANKLLWVAVPIFLVLAGLVLRGVWQSIGSRGLASTGKDTDNSDLSGASFTSLYPEKTDSIPKSDSYSPFSGLITPVTPNPSLAACHQPVGWVLYTVKPTDSLFRLSLVFGVSISDLQKVNCLSENAAIQPGQILFVPAPPTATPTPTPSPTRTPRPYVPPANPTRNPKTQRTRQAPLPTATNRPPAPPPTNPPPPPPPIATNPPPPTPTSPPPPTPTNVPPPTATPPRPPTATDEGKPPKHPTPTPTSSLPFP